MKKLLIIIVVITLPLILFFQYKKYKRFNPATDYEYKINDKVDLNYHDSQVVNEYYSKAVEIGAYARKWWRSEGIDVKFPDNEVQEEKNVALKYNQLLSRVKLLEDKLLFSTKMKTKGFSNDDIIKLESGFSERWINFSENELIGLQIGKMGDDVWELQSFLIKKGYNHPHDGVFGAETLKALKKFQVDNDLFPSGVLTKQTFKKILTK